MARKRKKLAQRSSYLKHFAEDFCGHQVHSSNNKYYKCWVLSFRKAKLERRELHNSWPIIKSVISSVYCPFVIMTRFFMIDWRFFNRLNWKPANFNSPTTKTYLKPGCMILSGETNSGEKIFVVKQSSFTAATELHSFAGNSIEFFVHPTSGLILMFYSSCSAEVDLSGTQNVPQN